MEEEGRRNVREREMKAKRKCERTGIEGKAKKRMKRVKRGE